MIRIVLIAGLVSLAGCTSAVQLRNPSTGATARCGPYNNTSAIAAASAMRESQCISDYQRQGFERVSN